MDTIFMNSENSKASYPHRLLINFLDKINVKRIDGYVALSTISVYCTWENIKKSSKNKNLLKYQLRHGMKNLNYLMDHVLYQMVKITLNISSKNMRVLLVILQ